MEVQRLWDQFQQLGASRVTGRLNPAISPGSRLNYNSHLFINSLPKTGGNISFLNYCIACKGIEDFSEDEKLRAIFRLYNDGKEWDYSTLRKLVQSVYPRENDDVIKSTTDTLLSQFTYGSHDYVTEMDFMRFMQSFDDRNLLENCLAYKIVPQYLKNRPRDDHLSDYLPTTRSGDIRGKKKIPGQPFGKLNNPTLDRYLKDSRCVKCWSRFSAVFFVLSFFVLSFFIK